MFQYVLILNSFMAKNFLLHGYIPHLIYLFISQWVFGLFLIFGYDEQCCCEYFCVSFCVDICFYFFWVYTQVWNVWVIFFMFNILRTCSSIFLKLLHAFLPLVCKLHNFSSFPPALVIIFFIIAILVVTKWFDFPFVVTNDVEHLFILFIFKVLFIYFQREGKGRRKRGRETSMCGCVSHAPSWGPGMQPRHVPRLGIEPVTPWFTGWCSIH